MIDEKKLIERLKEYQDKLDTDMWAKESGNWYGHYCNGMSEGIDDAIATIYQLAEENKGGWIPCSERLPETNESVLCWAKSTARGGDVCFVGSCHNGFWFLQSSADTHSFPGQYVIVAWQPLPDPYKEPERVDRS